MFLLLACVEDKPTPTPDPTPEDTACVPTDWHADADGDGFGAGLVVAACVAPDGHVADATDCDDTDAGVFPGAPEHCDARDENCDGVDDAPITTWYSDNDGDGFGDPALATDTCDGAGLVADGTDCDDTDATVFPGATEVCDEDDDNCDGRADLGVVQTWHTDTDGDGWGHMYNTTDTCDPEPGWVLDGSDCRPGDAEAYPGAPERCNDDDDDCDTLVDEDMDLDGDGYRSTRCTDGDDCDDGAADVNPGAEEIACSDGVDQDCDGIEACGYYGDVSVTTADVHLWSTSPGSSTGRLFGVGDLDADGTTDLVVTAIVLDNVGAGFVVQGPLSSGALQSVAYTASADRSIYYAGRSVGVGDLDGDGVDDVSWGAPYGNPTGAFVNLGPITGDVALLDAGLQVEGSGSDVAGHGADVADVTGDGQADLVLGAYYADDAAINSGSVYVFEGPLPAGTLSTATDATATIASDVNSELVGRFVVAGRDVDGDGLGDMLVGAPYLTSGAPNSGGAYLVLGPGTDSVFADAEARLLGEAARDECGEALALGDLDGDGHAEVIVASAANGGAAGAVYVVFAPVGDIDLSTADIIVRGDTADQAAGTSVSAGDVDGNGDDELILGGVGDATAGNGAGAAWLYMEPAAGTWSVADADGRFLGASADDALGGGVSLVDVSGDSRADIVLGATSDGTGATTAGGAYVFYSP